MFVFGTSVVALGLAASLLALIKGDVAERVAAALILANLVVATACFWFLNSQLADLCVDAITAIALLPITMRYASLWLGVVMLVYSIQFGLDAYYIVLDRKLDFLHSMINNIDTMTIGLALLSGTLMAWIRRHRESRLATF